MLYFSETDWTLPDMAEVNAEFDRDYDQNEYEQKIAGLVGRIYSREDRSEADKEAWAQAVEKLSGEDHYLLVLLSATTSSQPTHQWLPVFGSDSTGAAPARPQGDIVRLILVALACTVLMLGAIAIYHAFFESR